MKKASIFLAEVESMFDHFPESLLPRAPFFSNIMKEIDGLATPNTLALLACCARGLGLDEAYLEVGSFNGLTAVTVGCFCRSPLILVDDFSMGTTVETVRRELLKRHLGDRSLIIEGDAVETVIGTKFPNVGLFYYDADHSYEATLLCLRGVRPSLATEALIVVDDADWPSVAEAVARFTSENEEASLLIQIVGIREGQNHWWHGGAVLAWRGRDRSYNIES